MYPRGLVISAILDHSVIIPLYNEGENLRPLYNRIAQVLNCLPGNYEIIFIDDGSTDSSYSILKGIASSDKTVKVISFKKNAGQHKAVVAGILQASGDYLITMDADLQNPPEEIPRLLKKAAEGFDMVSGHRKVRKDKIKRRICSYLTNCVISAITGLRMKDYGSMLRVYKRETARNLAYEFIRSECYITMLIAKVTRSVSEIEVDHDERYAGESKYSFRKLTSAFLRIFRYYGITNNILVKKKGTPLFCIRRKVENGQEIIITP